MSAIWGIVDLSGKAVPEQLAQRMTAPFLSKKIDRFSLCSEGNAFLACGLQHFTPQAQNERFPYRAPGKRLVADVVLDNREALLQAYGLSRATAATPDGQILAACFFARPDDAVQDMLGAYAFACYNEAAGQVSLVGDAMGNRAVYYCLDGGRVCFSSLLRPLLEVTGNRPPNERWLADFFAQNNFIAVTEPSETPYQGVFRLAPGEWVTIDRRGIEKTAYWAPKADPVPRRQTDEACKRQFLQVFEESVTATLRSAGETGILLSGGLDSSAVAAWAAPCLGRRGKRLFSFTAVPADGYTPSGSPGAIDDETPNVLAMQRMYPALLPGFVDACGKNAWDERRALYAMLETPYKSMQNMVWMLACCRRAADAGCRVVLTGQYGNITVSFGSAGTRLHELLLRLRWAELAREVNTLHRRYHASRKALLLGLAAGLVPRTPGKAAVLANCFLRRDVFARNHCYARLKKAGCLDAGPLTMKAARAYLYDKKALRQIGEAEMKLSLETGVLLRDPTRDKRLVTLLLSFPHGQFCRGGTPGRLIREYMRDRLPPQITDDVLHKGRQSADTVYRLAKHWRRIHAELAQAFRPGEAAAFLDMAKLRREWERMRDLPEDTPAFDVIRLLYHGLACEILAERG